MFSYLYLSLCRLKTIYTYLNKIYSTHLGYKVDAADINFFFKGIYHSLTKFPGRYFLLEEHIDFCVKAMQARAEELGLKGNAPA